jgi:hypothetical protein
MESSVPADILDLTTEGNRTGALVALNRAKLHERVDEIESLMGEWLAVDARVWGSRMTRLWALDQGNVQAEWLYPNQRGLTCSVENPA